MANLDRKKYLIDIGGGYYISQSDPQYWYKMLRFKPNDGESLFHVGLDYEEEAKRNLLLFQRTKNIYFYNTYKEYMEKALTCTQRAARNGYVIARQDSLRIENDLKHQADLQTPIEPIKKGSKPLIIMHVILALLIIGALLFFFSQENQDAFTKPTIINNNFASFIPYQVKYEKPTIVPSLSYREERITVDPSQSLPLVDALVNKLKETYKVDSSAPIRVKAVDSKNGSEKGIVLWNGPNSGAEVYIYPETEINTLLFENTTVVRSALYQFVKKNGYFPTKLGELVKPFPENYLSSLPKDPQTLSSQETSYKDGTGGWVYRPQGGGDISESNLKSLVEKALEPNLSDLEPIKFEPLEIEISKPSNRLILKAGDKQIRNYFVALGKEGSTPEGEFTIQKKIANPNKNIPESVFGTRALELSNPSYAIHGTNDPTSIGKNVSHGCIRLNNQDIEELYSMVPLATPVSINLKGEVVKAEDVISNPIPNRYINKNTDSKEEDPSEVYYWSN
jgi:lipoprotein-anchoring transpeptidase ErfK/SrfK